MTTDDLRKLDPAGRWLAFLEQLALRYGGDGWSAAAIKALADEFEVHPATVYRWKDKPETLPFPVLVALAALNQRENRPDQARNAVILDELARASENLAQIARAFEQIAGRAREAVPTV